MTLEQRAKRGQMRAATDLRHPLTSQCQWRMPSPWGHGHINRSSHRKCFGGRDSRTEVNAKTSRWGCQPEGNSQRRAPSPWNFFQHLTCCWKEGWGDLWEGKCRPDTEFKFLLDWALTLPTKTCVTPRETIWNVNRWYDHLLTLNVFFCHLWGWEFQSKVRTVEKNRTSFSHKT